MKLAESTIFGFNTDQKKLETTDTKKKIIFFLVVYVFFSIAIFASCEAKASSEILLPPTYDDKGNPVFNEDGTPAHYDCTDGNGIDGSTPIERFCRGSYDDETTERVKTVGGILKTTYQNVLLLNDKEIIRGEWIGIQQGYFEKDSLPSLFVVNISPLTTTTFAEIATEKKMKLDPPSGTFFIYTFLISAFHHRSLVRSGSLSSVRDRREGGEIT